MSRLSAFVRVPPAEREAGGVAGEGGGQVRGERAEGGRAGAERVPVRAVQRRLQAVPAAQPGAHPQPEPGREGDLPGVS